MLEVGEQYNKEQLYELLDVPLEKRKGSWNTGYVKFRNNIYVFVNIGIPGRTGHDYNNHWDDDKLVWYAKTGTHLGQELIKELLNKNIPKHIFTREKERDPFIYEGVASDFSHEDVRPVKIIWEFLTIMENQPVIDLIHAIKEAPDDKVLALIASLRRTRNGQSPLKRNLLRVYDKKCCITGCNVAITLDACHIEPHHLNGNNHSSNALLLRTDIHVLWDKNMIGIHPDHLTIHINKALIDTKYACLEGLKLSSRNDNKSLNISALRLRWDEFLHPHDTLLTNM
jgi:hypothetical protein